MFIFHGLGGYPEENWFPWLKRKLEEKGHHVTVPRFPGSEAPKLQEWLEHFEKYRGDVNAGTIFVGHSLGGAFALRQLERFRNPIRATFLVASASGTMGNEFDSIVSTFTDAPYDWEKICRNCAKFSVLHAPDDPYIALSQANALAENLGVSVTVIRNGGHFNASSGFKTFPRLLEEILAISNQGLSTQEIPMKPE